MSYLVVAIDNDHGNLELYEDLLTSEGYRVSLHHYGPDIFEKLNQLKPDLVISELFMRNCEPGWQFLHQVRKEQNMIDIPLILCTASTSEVKALEEQFKEYRISVVLKPFNIEELLEAVKLKLP